MVKPSSETARFIHTAAHAAELPDHITDNLSHKHYINNTNKHNLLVLFSDENLIIYY